MRKTIFEIENRLDIQKEFLKFVETFSEENGIFYDHYTMSFFRFLNVYIFNNWKYRDTYTDFYDYLEHIGISEYHLDGRVEISEERFLNFLELILNLYEKVVLNEMDYNDIDFVNEKLRNIIPHNIPIILEKLNYIAEDKGDHIILVKRDADVDSILEIVPENISDLLLEYNDIRNNNIETKRNILKQLDLYIEEDKKKYKNIGAETYNSIQTIVNKMGVNHPIKEEPYSSFDETTLIKWYDKCFKLMIHLIRMKDIIEINKERNSLVKDN